MIQGPVLNPLLRDVVSIEGHDGLNGYGFNGMHGVNGPNETVVNTFSVRCSKMTLTDNFPATDFPFTTVMLSW